MITLLSEILDAHGGLARWNSLNRVEATIITGGALWGLKSLRPDNSPRRMSVCLHEERASVKPFGQPNWHTDFTPSRIAIVGDDQSVVSERHDPRARFVNHQMHTAWDPLDRAYFNGYALWTYLTTPFLLALKGVELVELEPWMDADEEWRVVQATFPPSIASHSNVQEFFFDKNLMLRRHDYAVDVAGGFDAAQIVDGYVEANGIKVPTRRRAYTRAPTRQPNLDPLMVSIDLSEICFR